MPTPMPELPPPTLIVEAAAFAMNFLPVQDAAEPLTVPWLANTDPSSSVTTQAAWKLHTWRKFQSLLRMKINPLDCAYASAAQALVLNLQLSSICTIAPLLVEWIATAPAPGANSQFQKVTVPTPLLLMQATEVTSLVNLMCRTFTRPGSEQPSMRMP